MVGPWAGCGARMCLLVGISFVYCDAEGKSQAGTQHPGGGSRSPRRQQIIPALEN